MCASSGNSFESVPDDASILREIYRGKWRLPLLTQIISKPMRLSELMRLIPTASKKMLIDSLRSLERQGWIERTEFDTAVPHVEYAISPSFSGPVRRLLAILPAQGETVDTQLEAFAKSADDEGLDCRKEEICD